MGGSGSKAKVPAKPKAPKLSQTEEAQLHLMRQRDRCTKADIRLQKEMDILFQKAISAKTRGNMEGATQFLRAKKVKAKFRESIIAQMRNLELMVSKIEEQKSNIEVMKAIEEGAQTLRRLQQELPIEKAEAIMEEAGEAIEYSNEVSAVFDRVIGQNNAQVSAEIADELALLGIVQPPVGAVGVGLTIIGGNTSSSTAVATTAAATTTTAAVATEATNQAAASTPFVIDMPLPPTSSSPAAVTTTTTRTEERVLVPA